MCLNRLEMIVCYSITIYVLLIPDLTLGQTFSRTPRLCAYERDDSQYYPCALNLIGLNSWSLYRCPQDSKFDEISQQCLVKVPVNDAFDQLTSSSGFEIGPFQRVASFFLDRPEEPVLDFQQPSFDSTFEQDDDLFSSHGDPSMRLDEKPIYGGPTNIEYKFNYFPPEHPYPPPINEDELKYKKICYFTNWAQYRVGPAKFEPEHIDPFLCTHIIYAFAYINNETFLITKVEENDEDLYRRVNALKLTNPKLKTLLGVGGWNMESHAFSTMVHDSKKRRDFILDAINFLHKYQFDGFEADWEYPGIRGGQRDDKYYLTMFFQEFRDAVNVHSLITGQPRLLIAAAVAANQDIVMNGYEIDKIAKVLDFINVMAYDFHGSWQNHTGLNAPLYRRFDEEDEDVMLNQDSGVHIWLDNGAPAHKIVLGLPLFARSFRLAHPDQNFLRAPSMGNGTEGPFTRSPGFLSYFEVCLLQKDRTWRRRSVADGSESEYMYKGREWISYDTLENIQKRAAYVVANHLGGLFVWSIDMDDFTGIFCQNGTYPFIRNSLSLLPTEMPSYL